MKSQAESPVSTSGWRLSLAAPVAALPVFEAAFGELGGALVSDAPEAGGPVSLQLYLTEEPARARVTALLAAASLAAGIEPPEAVIEPLPETDWVAMSERALPAISAGPFYIYGAHVTGPPPPGSIPILIEASSAFGTGRHESTRGCLLALAGLAEARAFGNALDMGCGSGILAFAAAKLWSCPVLAVDNDETAVLRARENAAINGVAGLVQATMGEGFGADGVSACAPFDLIIENLLAWPISHMAPDLMAHLAPGGVAVLSGILADQENQVLASHNGLGLVRRIALGEWVTLVLQG